MSPKILVIDDELGIVQVLAIKLRKAGFEVFTAVDGEEGADAARTHLPDIILTDHQMPYLTGTEMCRVLLEDVSTAGIPVIILTARGHSLDDADRSLGNVQRVLSKPFSPREVLEIVEEILARQTAGVSETSGGAS